MALWPRINRQDALNPAVQQAYSAPGNLMAAMQNMQAQIYGAQLPSYEPRFAPSADYPNTLGWRAWVWDMTANELRSPVQGTTWNGTELRCERWVEGDAVRGVAGIHARLVPDDWHKIVMPEAHGQGRAYAETRSGDFRACIAIQGVVERFGKYVLGEDGWRAEWVQIRKLAAPTDDIGLALEKAFPEVEIVYGNR